MIARVVATLNCLAPGQTFLGVGAGEAHEYTATGLWAAIKHGRCSGSEKS
jgi:alkanesulfonate monooxygenase SsuD/methylene tetrahydromethanopterin reductase-like flavin-dependent oxidoreductase (luciferase family)